MDQREDDNDVHKKVDKTSGLTKNNSERNVNDKPHSYFDKHQNSKENCKPEDDKTNMPGLEPGAMQGKGIPQSKADGKEDLPSEDAFAIRKKNWTKIPTSKRKPIMPPLISEPDICAKVPTSAQSDNVPKLTLSLSDIPFAQSYKPRVQTLAKHKLHVLKLAKSVKVPQSIKSRVSKSVISPWRRLPISAETTRLKTSKPEQISKSAKPVPSVWGRLPISAEPTRLKSTKPEQTATVPVPKSSKPIPSAWGRLPLPAGLIKPESTLFSSAPDQKVLNESIEIKEEPIDNGDVEETIENIQAYVDSFNHTVKENNSQSNDNQPTENQNLRPISTNSCSQESFRGFTPPLELSCCHNPQMPSELPTEPPKSIRVASFANSSVQPEPLINVQSFRHLLDIFPQRNPSYLRTVLLNHGNNLCQAIETILQPQQQRRKSVAKSRSSSVAGRPKPPNSDKGTQTNLEEPDTIDSTFNSIVEKFFENMGTYYENQENQQSSEDHTTKHQNETNLEVTGEISTSTADNVEPMDTYVIIKTEPEYDFDELPMETETKNILTETETTPTVLDETPFVIYSKSQTFYQQNSMHYTSNSTELFSPINEIETMDNDHTNYGNMDRSTTTEPNLEGGNLYKRRIRKKRRRISDHLALHIDRTVPRYHDSIAVNCSNPNTATRFHDSPALEDRPVINLMDTQNFWNRAQVPNTGRLILPNYTNNTEINYSMHNDSPVTDLPVLEGRPVQYSNPTPNIGRQAIHTGRMMQPYYSNPTERFCGVQNNDPFQMNRTTTALPALDVSNTVLRDQSMLNLIYAQKDRNCGVQNNDPLQINRSATALPALDVLKDQSMSNLMHAQIERNVGVQNNDPLQINRPATALPALDVSNTVLGDQSMPNLMHFGVPNNDPLQIRRPANALPAEVSNSILRDQNMLNFMLAQRERICGVQNNDPLQINRPATARPVLDVSNSILRDQIVLNSMHAQIERIRGVQNNKPFQISRPAISLSASVVPNTILRDQSMHAQKERICGVQINRPATALPALDVSNTILRDQSMPNLMHAQRERNYGVQNNDPLQINRPATALPELNVLNTILRDQSMLNLMHAQRERNYGVQINDPFQMNKTATALPTSDVSNTVLRDQSMLNLMYAQKDRNCGVQNNDPVQINRPATALPVLDGLKDQSMPNLMLAQRERNCGVQNNDPFIINRPATTLSASNVTNTILRDQSMLNLMHAQRDRFCGVQNNGSFQINRAATFPNHTEIDSNGSNWTTVHDRSVTALPGQQDPRMWNLAHNSGRFIPPNSTEVLNCSMANRATLFNRPAATVPPLEELWNITHSLNTDRMMPPNPIQVNFGMLNRPTTVYPAIEDRSMNAFMENFNLWNLSQAINTGGVMPPTFPNYSMQDLISQFAKKPAKRRRKRKAKSSVSRKPVVPHSKENLTSNIRPTPISNILPSTLSNFNPKNTISVPTFTPRITPIVPTFSHGNTHFSQFNSTAPGTNNLNLYNEPLNLTSIHEQNSINDLPVNNFGLKQSNLRTQQNEPVERNFEPPSLSFSQDVPKTSTAQQNENFERNFEPPSQFFSQEFPETLTQHNENVERDFEPLCLSISQDVPETLRSQQNENVDHDFEPLCLSISQDVPETLRSQQNENVERNLVPPSLRFSQDYLENLTTQHNENVEHNVVPPSISFSEDDPENLTTQQNQNVEYSFVPPSISFSEDVPKNLTSQQNQNVEYNFVPLSLSFSQDDPKNLTTQQNENIEPYFVPPSLNFSQDVPENLTTQQSKNVEHNYFVPPSFSFSQDDPENLTTHQNENIEHNFVPPTLSVSQDDPKNLTTQQNENVERDFVPPSLGFPEENAKVPFDLTISRRDNN